MRTFIAALLLIMCSSTVGAEIVVVASLDSPISKMSQREVTNIFMAKTNRNSEGKRVTAIELSDSDCKTEFYKVITGKTISQLKSYWSKLIFTGKGKPPRSFDENKSLVEELNNNDYAVTYIPANQLTQSMKVVYDFRN
ncbi:MAG: hypothetical protein OEY06_03845 [Gammaproteobacteria bacterium]|nr:hypothetical protein [Gammaproteobacteria bacterium]